MIYGYQDYNDITPDQLLQKITQQQIFEYILQAPFSFDSRYCSPLREDKRPGCRFEQVKDGTILFVDFGDTIQTHRTCFKLLMDKDNINLTQTIDLLCTVFNLSTHSQDYKAPQVTFAHNTTEHTDHISDTIITYDPKPILKEDKIYWSSFLIKPEHLYEDNVHPTGRFHIQKSNSKRKSITIYKYCYAIDFIHHVKIYQPFSQEYRFITNCDEDDIGNVNNLPATGEILYIASSYKDHRVIRNIYNPNVVWFHNEGAVPAPHILSNLLSRFKRIVIFYDNDLKGISSAYKLSNILKNISRIIGSGNLIEIKYIPIKYDYKDPGEFVSKEGRTDTIRMFNQIKL